MTVETTTGDTTGGTSVDDGVETLRVCRVRGDCGPPDPQDVHLVVPEDHPVRLASQRSFDSSVGLRCPGHKTPRSEGRTTGVPTRDGPVPVKDTPSESDDDEGPST